MRNLASVLLAVSPAVLALATTAAAEVPKVETDIPPVAALVAQVMEGLGTPGMLLDKGGDEHDMQLRPSQMRSLSTADLLIWVGPELTPGLETARASAPGLQSLALLDDPATQRRDYAAGGLNPHAWLAPGNASVWIDLIAARLTGIDPEHAAIYKANAAKAQASLAALDKDLATRLSVLKAPFVTYHDAYGYFAQTYHLTYLGGLAAGDAAPPGAARISELHAMAAGGAIACAFPEAQHDPALITNLAQGTSVFVGPGLDPVGSMLDQSADAYEQLLTNLTDSLLTCASHENP
jgi:zinc transport system substrate-binding protein